MRIVTRNRFLILKIADWFKLFTCVKNSFYFLWTPIENSKIVFVFWKTKLIFLHEIFAFRQHVPHQKMAIRCFTQFWKKAENISHQHNVNDPLSKLAGLVPVAQLLLRAFPSFHTGVIAKQPKLYIFTYRYNSSKARLTSN